MVWTMEQRQLARRRSRRARNRARYLAGQASGARTAAMLHMMRTRELDAEATHVAQQLERRLTRPA